MKLYALYIGGEMQGANIEVHDMRFVMAPSLEKTYGPLRKQWWGIPRSLHLDGWAELKAVDGYRIRIGRVPATHAEKLYYVNVGGYDTSQFTELHRNCFVVATSEHKAKIKALRSVRDWVSFHRDDLYEAEQVFCLSEMEGLGYYIHLTPDPDATKLAFTCAYKAIGRTTKAG